MAEQWDDFTDYGDAGYGDDAGYGGGSSQSILISPPGVEAPFDEFNFNIDSDTLSPPGYDAPVDEYNYSFSGLDFSGGFDQGAFDVSGQGRAQGLSGADLATFAQRHGQRSQTPEAAGTTYNSLFGTQTSGQDWLRSAGDWLAGLGATSAYAEDNPDSYEDPPFGLDPATLHAPQTPFAGSATAPASGPVPGVNPSGQVSRTDLGYGDFPDAAGQTPVAPGASPSAGTGTRLPPDLEAQLAGFSDYAKGAALDAYASNFKTEYVADAQGNPLPRKVPATEADKRAAARAAAGKAQGDTPKPPAVSGSRGSADAATRTIYNDPTIPESLRESAANVAANTALAQGYGAGINAAYGFIANAIKLNPGLGPKPVNATGLGPNPVNASAETASINQAGETDRLKMEIEATAQRDRDKLAFEYTKLENAKREFAETLARQREEIAAKLTIAREQGASAERIAMAQMEANRILQEKKAAMDKYIADQKSALDQVAMNQQRALAEQKMALERQIQRQQSGAANLTSYRQLQAARQTRRQQEAQFARNYLLQQMALRQRAAGAAPAGARGGADTSRSPYGVPAWEANPAGF